MATSEDVIKFQKLASNDRILCTTRDHTRDLARSVQAMELVDEIRDIHVKLLVLSGMVVVKDENLTRSSMLVSILREYLDSLILDLEIAESQDGF